MKKPCSSLLAGLLLTLSLVACSDQPSPADPLQPPTQGGGSGAGAGPLGAAGAGASGTLAGSTSMAGSGSAGGGSSGGGGGAGGSVASGGGGVGGVMSTGGASAGAAGAGGPGVADMLDGFRLEAPCMDAEHFGLDKTDNCEIAMAVDRQSYQRTIAGDPNVVYDVRLRVRGLAEPNVYVDGALTPPRYYVGGHSSTPDYSAYSLTVGEPAQVYYFNYSETTGHFVFLVDCEVVVPMRGGTQVSFDVNGQGSVPNGHGVSNRERVIVPEIAPAPAPFNGQFMQFDVLSVTTQE